MGVLTSPICTLCSHGSIGTFMHVFWECPPVSAFWGLIAQNLSDMFDVDVPKSVPALIFNSLPQQPSPVYRIRILMAGLTAAKKLVASRWKYPDGLNVANWRLTFLDIIFLEQSTARIMGLSDLKVTLWNSAAETLKGHL